MRRRHFLALAGLTAAVILLVLLMPSQLGDQAHEGKGTPVLTGLADRINDVDRVVVSDRDGALVTLERNAARWTINELDGYPADWPALRELLGDLAQMETAELKTDNPAYFSRLGVEDLSEPEAPGLEIDLAAGDDSWSLIAGNESEMQDGQYLRVKETEQALLADRSLALPREPVDWALDEIMDVGPGLIAEVSIQHPDGEQVRISKVSADDTNFTLRTLPAGREPLSEYKVNSLVNAYSALRMEDARKDPGAQTEAPVQVKLVLFSGERYGIEVFTWDDERWIRVKPAAKPDTNSSAAAEAGETGSGVDLEGWVYRVPKARLDMMTTRLDTLLKPLDSEAGTGSQ